MSEYKTFHAHAPLLSHFTPPSNHEVPTILPNASDSYSVIVNPDTSVVAAIEGYEDINGPSW
jgi:hypothetical protein